MPDRRYAATAPGSQGLPWAARPIITASAPVYDSTRRACSGLAMSPLAMTGMETARFTARIESYSATPLNAHLRVRPCTATAAIPADSAICAIRTALRRSGDGPVRIFTVTGTSAAATTRSRMRPTSASSDSSAEPAATLHTFFAGQPMLMSMMSAPCATLNRAASASCAGSAPAICTDRGAGSPE